jgi:sulfite reductase alpha subunit-like flavoprotein
VIIVGATHGDGGPPLPAKKFYQQWIMLKNVDNVLKGMKFTLFGLGDK